MQINDLIAKHKKFPIWVIPVTLAVAAGIYFLTKKSNDDPIPPDPVTLQFDVFNHTQGYRNQFSKTVLSGDSLVIKVSDLGINDVDPQRIAVRQDNFSSLVTYSGTGEAAFTAPKQSMSTGRIFFLSFFFV